MSSGAPDARDAREQAIDDWERENTRLQGLGRRFSGERLRGIARSDWPAKAAFAIGTAVVLAFVFTHGGGKHGPTESKRRAEAQVAEPSVRDFRPLVMPYRAATPPPRPAAAASDPPIKQARDRTEDPEAAARRENAARLEDARTKSEIIVKGNSVAGSPATGGQDAWRVASAPPEGAGADRRDPNLAFSQRASSQTVTTVSPRKLGDLRCIALQGKMIDAELETAIDTDLPGQIRAIVSSPLYAEQGRSPLIPAGARVIGVYNSTVRKGQVRVFVIWNRVIRPDGVEIMVHSSATDALGEAGLQGQTDNHFGQIFGMSALLSVIGAGAGTVGVSPDSRYNSADEYRRELQQSFSQTSDRVLGPYASIPPTDTVAQGEQIKVFLNRDLDFCPLKAARHEQTELTLP
ncbi:MAG: TrbI/VirB10 family protein [Burkholderiales bacterium]